MARGGIDNNGVMAFGTFYADGSVSAVALASATIEGKGVVGNVVTLVGNNACGYGGAGSPVFGKIEQYEDDGKMTIQFAGVAEVPGVSGKLPTAGGATTGYVVCNGSGAVSTATAGKTVIAVDNTASVNTAFVLLG